MNASENEYSHIVKLDEIGAGSSKYTIAADEGARAKLATRFDLVALDMLEADIALVRTGMTVRATGAVRARVTQACIASGDPVITTMNEPIEISFIPEPQAETDVEIELESDDCDTVFHDNKAVDLGEAVAQTLGLALDPYPRSADAEAKLKAAGVKAEGEVVPIGAFAGLKDKLAGK